MAGSIGRPWPFLRLGQEPKVTPWADIAAFCLCSVLLVGCGPRATTTTVTRTTTTTVTATTVTTTTATITPWVGPGGCRGRDLSELRDKAQWCFCLYTGQCRQHFNCSAGEDLPTCQRNSCGEATTYYMQYSASFLNIRDWADVLTIPKFFAVDVRDLRGECPDGGLEMLTFLLEDGRVAFQGLGRPAPTWQCVHLPGNVGVYWLHVHTFVNAVHIEMLPAQPPLAACAPATLRVDLAARRILAQVALLGRSAGSTASLPTVV
mmetsp:Transcript_24141/g.75776  ORF Transcript_24141/g.75776 Transcript_24141/m.75776 type:complete len:263 (+) Transcript_24141:78-866(+)